MLVKEQNKPTVRFFPNKAYFFSFLDLYFLHVVSPRVQYIFIYVCKTPHIEVTIPNNSVIAHIRSI